MPFSAQVLHNPVSGERFVFHTTAGDSAGRPLEFRPGGRAAREGARRARHPRQRAAGTRGVSE